MIFLARGKRRVQGRREGSRREPVGRQGIVGVGLRLGNRFRVEFRVVVGRPGIVELGIRLGVDGLERLFRIERLVGRRQRFGRRERQPVGFGRRIERQFRQRPARPRVRGRPALPERRSWRRIRLRLPSRPDVATRGILSGMTSTAYSFDAALDEGGCLRVRFAKDALRPHARFSQDAG